MNFTILKQKENELPFKRSIVMRDQSKLKFRKLMAFNVDSPINKLMKRIEGNIKLNKYENVTKWEMNN